MVNKNKSEIIIYKTPEGNVRVDVILMDDTFWLTQKAIAKLFGVEIPAISKHLKNIFESMEHIESSVVSKMETTAIDGKNYLTSYYSLDAIIAVGYRVNSYNATQFRIWATNVLKDYLLKGYAFNVRMNRVEYDIEDLKSKVGEIDLQIKSSLLPAQGIFFDGQIFDAYLFAGDLIRSAKESLILIDNYVDDSVLTHFTKRSDKVNFYILTKNISKQLQLDIEKHNSQYKPVMIKKFEKAHDRFLIIDNKEVYHLGASLKDLGKKWFAFSKMDKSSVSNILNEIMMVVGV
jgi:hypothetical protein